VSRTSASRARPGGSRVGPGRIPGGSQADPGWSQDLLSWFAREQRALPWRVPTRGGASQQRRSLIELRDPYRVWVSEIMLQQTRVATVLRYYEPFVARFPDVGALAAAHEDDLMKAWEGLGYYRRARLLQRGARHVVEHGFPKDRDGWAEVPGVGRYTAGAIASLAIGEAVPAVDGNVLRIFSRQTCYKNDIAAPAAKRAAEAWVLVGQPRGAPGAFNEALMELGATVCTPTAPRCDACPVRASCTGREVAADLPRKAAKRAPKEMRVALAIVRRGERFLVEKREAGLLAGTWGFPWVEGGASDLAAHVQRIVGATARVGGVVATGDHVFTHRRWSMRAFDVSTRGKKGEWRDLDEIALGSAHRKILRRLVER